MVEMHNIYPLPMSYLEDLLLGTVPEPVGVKRLAQLRDVPLLDVRPGPWHRVAYRDGPIPDNWSDK